MDQENIKKLKLFMEYNNISTKMLALNLNISERTLKTRLEGKTDFNSQEIDLFYKVFGYRDTNIIFFKRYWNANNHDSHKEWWNS